MVMIRRVHKPIKNSKCAHIKRKHITIAPSVSPPIPFSAHVSTIDATVPSNFVFFFIKMELSIWLDLFFGKDHQMNNVN